MSDSADLSDSAEIIPAPVARVLTASSPAAIPSFNVVSEQSDVDIEMPDYRKFNTSSEQIPSIISEMIYAEATAPVPVETIERSEPVTGVESITGNTPELIVVPNPRPTVKMIFAEATAPNVAAFETEEVLVAAEKPSKSEAVADQALADSSESVRPEDVSGDADKT